MVVAKADIDLSLMDDDCLDVKFFFDDFHDDSFHVFFVEHRDIVGGGEPCGVKNFFVVKFESVSKYESFNCISVYFFCPLHVSDFPYLFVSAEERFEFV